MTSGVYIKTKKRSWVQREIRICPICKTKFETRITDSKKYCCNACYEKSKKIIKTPRKVAVIGCGLIGRKRAFTLKDHEIVFFCDIDANKAYNLACDIDLIKAEKIGSKLITDDWQEVVDNKDVELVIISTTNDLLTSIAIEAAKNGKHILMEKPGARNSKELSKLLKYDNKVKIKVGFNLRYHQAINMAHVIAKDGDIGELMFVRAQYGHGGRLNYENEWRFDKEISGGGELLDQGVHVIDLAKWFLGDFTKVDGDIRTYFWDTKLEDNAFLNLKTKDGKTAFLHVSCTEWKNTFCFEIYGKKGKLKIEGLGGSYGPEKLTLYQMTDEMLSPKSTTWKFPQDYSWQNEIDEFIHCNIEHNAQIERGRLRDAYETLKIVDRIYKKN